MIAVVAQRSRGKSWLLIVLLLLLVVVGSVSYLGWRQSVPVPRASVQAPRFLGHNASFTVALETARGSLRRAEVRIVQGGKPVTVAKADGAGSRVTLPVTVESAALGLKEGAATLEVWASDDFWRPMRPQERALVSQPVTIDLTPPRLELLASTRYVSPGGAVMVAFKAGDASRGDVTVGKRAFPSFPYGPADRGARVALIALPYDYDAGTPLWSGPFVQPRNTKVFSNFAETRTYLYEGQTVDTQVHVGFDLASTKQSPVPAANSGQVAFAGPLTIYGNTVIVDHGLGLQTLYAHLSTIDVKMGDAVTKGQELGRSGSTGLAVGDHLHFEVLVSGVSVTPVEWWDGKWIRDRVNKPLKQAGLPEIAGIGAVPDEPTPSATPSSSRAGRRRR